ncbi:MAG: universal stress protein [Synechococcales cyanobacterium T60_A2020_003]|nr:universal stress protein [Synechococcales cyanobacterium T60_A2020_003]
MIKKILLADSGTGQSEAMLKILMDIPSIQQASVTVLHVVPPQVTAEGMTLKWEEGGKTLARAIQSLQLDPSQTNAMLREGEPKDLVCKVADEIDADLIIMGSRGLKRLQSILENSVSQYVFQLAQRPMLLVKDDIYVKRIRRILVAVDKSSSGQEAVQSAIALARDVKDSEVLLVHANPDISGKLDEQMMHADAEKDPVLQPAIAEAKKFSVKYRCFAPEGSPGARICQLAEDMSVDLIVLGSPDRRPSIAKGLPDLDRLLGQSLSDYVRVYAPCPVLLVRMPG